MIEPRSKDHNKELFKRAAEEGRGQFTEYPNGSWLYLTNFGVQWMKDIIAKCEAESPEFKQLGEDWERDRLKDA